MIAPFVALLGAMAAEELALLFAGTAISAYLMAPQGRKQLSDAIANTQLDMGSTFGKTAPSVQQCPLAMSSSSAKPKAAAVPVAQSQSRPSEESYDPCRKFAEAVNRAREEVKNAGDGLNKATEKKRRSLLNEVLDNIEDLEKELSVFAAHGGGFSQSERLTRDDTKAMEKLRQKIAELNKKYDDIKSGRDPETRTPSDEMKQQKQRRDQAERKLSDAQAALDKCRSKQKADEDAEAIGDKHVMFYKIPKGF